MMSIIERYKWYKLGIVKKNVNEKMQMFFKTQPTEEQLLILDEMGTTSNNAINLALLLVFIFGAILGGLFVHFFLYYKSLLGLPLF